MAVYNYAELLETIQTLPIRHALVTGPQRSGTTIAARILADDLEWQYVDEDDYGHQSLAKFLLTVGRYEHAVAQGPAMSYICHLLPNDIAIVFMYRKIEDIVASENRVHWRNHGIEYAKYPREYYMPTIAETKYHYWRSFQIDYIQYGFELDYESLSGHSLFLPKDKRQRFQLRQWQAN